MTNHVLATPASPIAARDLVKAYGGVAALDGVSLEVNEGTIFGLLGPNGAGKTTAVKILTTLSPPDGGEARVAGLDVARDAAAVRRAIGIVFQRHTFDAEATGRENLELQAEIYGVTGAARRARTEELLRQFDLSDAADRLAKTYSGGMQRRLDVALALVHRPRVLFLDEPTTGLDPEARAELWREIERLIRDDVTVLLTTHYLEEADRLASRIAIIDCGRIVAEGTPDGLKAELRGDAVQIELGGDVTAAVVAAVEPLPGIAEPMLDGRVLRARAEDGAAAVPALIAALEQHGFAVAAATISRPSLDDVYLRHAGRVFREADTKRAELAA